MNLWWECSNCGEVVDFTKEASSVFDEDGEADFDPNSGLFFHTLFCNNVECGTTWIMSISEANNNKRSELDE